MTQFDLSMTNRRKNALYAISLAGLVVALLHWNANLALAALAIHVAVVSIFSAVAHRYFCHRAYEANPTLAFVLSIVPVAYSYATPIAWSALHSAHHAHADTDKDTHVRGWRALLTASYRSPPARFFLTARWFRDAQHEALHRYALGVVVAWLAILSLFSLDALLWLGLVPIATLNILDGVHRALSHSGGHARNLWYLEYIFPMGGEWIHERHHDTVREARFSRRWFEIDSGSVVARLLARSAR
jgi:fatty-acid desaturase